ncbi:MAG: LamG domain-containing protein, partial [Armatimonadetes bacterium]|nr:LamG domain-containing protein [Armatimonadota bacterium]
MVSYGKKIALIVLVTITMLVPGQLASGSDFTAFRGASLDDGYTWDWPCKPSKWDTVIWTGNKTAKDEVHEYLHRLQALGFNCVSKILPNDTTADWYGPDQWNEATLENLCEFIDLVDEHDMKMLFHFSLTAPCWDDDRGTDDLNGNDGQIYYWPNGLIHVPSPAMWQKSDNPTLYNAVIRQAKDNVDRVVGYVAAHRPASRAILCWVVDYNEMPWWPCNADFVRDMAPYFKQVDPYHPVAAELKAQVVYNGQIVMMSNAPGHNDPEITLRDVSSALDIITLANYDLCDGNGNDRFPLVPYATTFLNQVSAQNAGHKPVILQEFGSNMNPKDVRSSYLVQRVNSDTGPAADWQGTFEWCAPSNWDDRVDPNRWSMFTYDTSKTYYLGASYPHAKVIGERFRTHPWASYTFDDRNSATTALDGQSRYDLTLYNGATKGAGKTGKGLVLNGIDQDAEAAYDPSMDRKYLYLEAWINPTEAQLGGIASKNGSWTLYLAGDAKLHIWANTGSGWGGKLDSVGTIPYGTWTRIVMSYDGRYWRVYINGSLNTTVEDVGEIQASGSELRIGATGGGSPLYFEGGIDEVQICPVPGPLVRLKCDESSGSSLSDSSGNTLNATLYGGYDRSVAQPLPDGYAINFNGSTGYATVANTASKATGQTGLDFYMYPRNITSLQYVLSQGRDSYGSGWSVYISGGNLCLSVNTDNLDNGNEVVLSKAIPAANQWYHVRASYSGATAKLSIDGDEVTAAGSGPIVYRYGENLTLGRLASPAGYYYFNGALDQVECYSTAFSSPGTGGVEIGSGGPYATSVNVALTLWANDSSDNVAQMCLSNDGSTWTDWEPYATTKSWTLASGGGARTVYVRYKNSAGAVWGPYSDSILLDATAPVGSMKINGGAAYCTSTAVTLNLSATDDVSGVSLMRFYNNGYPLTTWQSYASSKSWSLPSGSGKKTVTVQFRDVAGNVSAYSASITYGSPITIPQAKDAADGANVVLAGKVVTAVASDGQYVYVEEPNRSAGVRVAGAMSVNVGDIVDIGGYAD